MLILAAAMSAAQASTKAGERAVAAVLAPDGPIARADDATLAYYRTPVPYYGVVPKDVARNLEFRRRVLEAGYADRDVAHGLWLMCAADPLFYINTFVWTYAPKLYPSMPVRPFVTWPFQDEAILGINDAIETGEDRAIRKSRDMGATWIGMTLIDWRYRFKEMQSFLIGSRKEDLVDKAGDPVALFWKLDFIEERLPCWLRPPTDRKAMHKENLANGSVVDGESMNENFARGDRRTMIFMDEFAAWLYGHAAIHSSSDSTDCRVLNSTPLGMGNAFYEQYTLLSSLGRIVDMHWTRHPVKARGLYHDADGKPRSPWYDDECKRRSPLEVAQELDMDFHGSDYSFFEEQVLRTIRMRDVRSPVLQGELLFDRETCEPTEFVERRGGPLLLWVTPDERNRLPEDALYALGVDVATGTINSNSQGASNSVGSACNALTGEKVAELAVSGMPPEAFAPLMMALGKWLRGRNGNPALMVWEALGPGAQFGRHIVDGGYGNVYYRRDERRRGAKITPVPGWHPNKETKNILLGEFRAALSAGTYIQRSVLALEECRSYVFTNQGVMHARAAVSVDPTGARDNHGDRVIADALSWKAAKELAQPVRAEKPEIPDGCLAYRRMTRQRRQQAAAQLKQGWLR